MVRIKISQAQAKKIYEGIGKDFPTGLQPMGNGLYKTPDTISVRDCDNYKESIYCGGNPFSNPFKNPIGVETDFGVNECGGFLSAAGTIAGIKLPTHSIAWIKPECRQNYEKGKTPEPPEIVDFDLKDLPPPQYAPNGFNANDRVAVVLSLWVYKEVQQYNSVLKSWRISRTTAHGIFTEANVPSSKLAYSSYSTVPKLGLCDATGWIQGTSYFNKEWNAYYLLRDGATTQSDRYAVDSRIHPAEPNFEDSYYDFEKQQHIYNYYDYKRYTAGFIGSPTSYLTLYIGRYGDIFPSKRLKYFVTSTIGNYIDPITQEWVTDPKSTQTLTRQLTVVQERLEFIQLVSGQPFENPYRFEPPPKPPKKCCMQCCSSSQQQQNQNDELLRKILRELMLIKKTVGVDEFPASVPETFLTKYDNSGKATHPQQITIENIPQLQAWSATAIEAVLGEMGAVIEIEDTDPTKEGNQSGKVVHKNMSELMLDCYSLVFDSWMMNHQSIQLHTKTLIQQSMTHRTNTQNYFALLALIDFFGFKPKEIKKKIPFTVSIGKETLEEFMKEKEEEVLVIDFDPSDPNCRSYQDDMIEVRHAVAMIRAQCWRKLNPDGSLGGQVIDLVKMGMSHIDKINSGKVDPRNPEGEVESDFDKFCEDAETQFSRITGINPEKPYGVPYANRPRITKLGGPSTDSTPT